MIKGGLVQRRPDPTDGRKSRVYLTARGRGLEAELLHYGIEINEVALRGIPRDQIKTCLAVLTRAAANLQEALKSMRVANDGEASSPPSRPLRRGASSQV
jgi:DNA-binding MarR family transcriptional regulator